MNTNETPLQARIRAAAASQTEISATKALSQEVRTLTARHLDSWGAVSCPSGAVGLESLGKVEAKRNRDFDAAADATPEELMSDLDKLGMPSRHIAQVTESCLLVLDKGYDAASVVRGGTEISGANLPMSEVVGRYGAAMIAGEQGSAALEAFGSDMDRLNTDDRLTMSLIIMRPWENIMDKAFARVNDSSPVVTIRVPKPEVYNWADTQKSNGTTSTRHTSTPLRDLYRNPQGVNTAAKKVTPVPANDVNDVLWNDAAALYKTGKEIDTIDLSLDANKFGFGMADRTDIISDGGIIDKVLVTVTDPTANSGAGVSNTFLLDTRALNAAMFVSLAMNTNSGDRQVSMPCVLPISATTKQWDGSNSTIATQLTDANLLIRLQVNASLNLQTGRMQSSGSANKELVAINGGAISGATNTLFGNLTVSYTAFSTDLRFNEENQRKADLAVWCQYQELQFVVPRSRVFITEYALAQDVDENAISATSTMVALGNGRRGLDTIVNRLNDVAASAKFVAANPDVAKYNSIDQTSLVSSLVKPTVLSTSMDFDVEELNVMNESTRLSEIHGRFRARVLSMCTQMMANSLMLNQYKGGETPVFKLFVHSTIADLVIGILDYHPDLDDREQVATGADYSMKLPNGYRLDVIKSNMDCLKQRVYGVPVIESDMSSLLSAASIRDCGTATLNYSPTNAGAVVRRVATCTREIVMMSNPVGFMMEVKGLGAQLGVSNYDAMALNANSSDAINV